MTERSVPMCEPDITVIASGEFLATTPRDHPYRIGTTGETVEQVQRRFFYALDRWEELHQRGVTSESHD